jgi:hypothetical protein
MQNNARIMGALALLGTLLLGQPARAGSRPPAPRTLSAGHAAAVWRQIGGLFHSGTLGDPGQPFVDAPHPTNRGQWQTLHPDKRRNVWELAGFVVNRRADRLHAEGLRPHPLNAMDTPYFQNQDLRRAMSSVATMIQRGQPLTPAAVSQAVDGHLRAMAAPSLQHK